MLYKNNIGPQVRRKRYALGWSQSTFAAKLQVAGLDISRSGVSKNRGAPALRGRQIHHVPRRGAEGPVAGTLSIKSGRQATLRLHGSARNDAFLNETFSDEPGQTAESAPHFTPVRSRKRKNTPEKADKKRTNLERSRTVRTSAKGFGSLAAYRCKYLRKGTLLSSKVVAGVGFEPTTFRL